MPSAPTSVSRTRFSWIHLFSSFAEKSSRACGSPYAFALAVFILVIWAATGPIFGYSELWQIVINTITTIITFLLVFLIQNSQNRETRALQLKLDEIIRATRGAHNSLLGIERLTEEELYIICSQYEEIAKAARVRLGKRKQEKATPEL